LFLPFKLAAIPRRRGSTRGTGAPVRGTSGRGSLRSTPERQCHTTSRTPGSQSHTQAGTPGSQSHTDAGTPGSQSHTTRRTPGRQSHTRTPGAPGVRRIEKNTRSRTRRQASSTHSRDPTPINTTTGSSSSQSGDEEASDYRNSSYNNSPLPTPEPQTSTPIAQSETSVTVSMEDTTRHSHSHPEPALRLNDIRALLQSHEHEIVNRVVTQLNTHQPPAQPPTPINRRTAAHPPIPVQSQNLTSMRITELENQLAELRAAQDIEQAETTGEELRALGTYNPTYSFSRDMRENASGIPESVELLFPGVERSTLVQIIENRFRTDKYLPAISNREGTSRISADNQHWGS